MDQKPSGIPFSLPPVSSNGANQTMPASSNNISNQPMPTAPLPNNNSSDVPKDSGSAAPTSQSNIAAPSIADDVDLIEKEWVHKIKEIIQNTQTDPYERTKQLTLLKNDYLQKRYNKIVNPA